MQCMIAGDNLGAKKGLLEICERNIHQQRIAGDTFYSQVLSYHATALLKTMWLCGNELEVNHPLIPMDLMPVTDEIFDVPYFFLEGYQGEIPEFWSTWKNEIEAEWRASGKDPKNKETFRDTKRNEDSKIKDTRVIKIKSEKGELVKIEVERELMISEYVMLNPPGQESYYEKITIGHDEWDEKIYEARKTAFYVIKMRELGYRVERGEYGSWKVFEN